ncbi:PCDHD1 [Acanthosepion pharaonis]|uniref:PCDHD1 n=1 Tax=Acanthosepion pharaonis TaxID=158019 RepID=A0A812BUI2_ACAPH|nr:PCDHD1 [Sepia pharaonis]
MAASVSRIVPSSSILRLLIISSVLQICSCVDLTYYVEEGKNPGTFVGDIAVDSHLLNTVPAQDRSLIRFLQLEQNTTGASKMFRVAKKTGKLYTTQTLDAETLCTYNTECFRMVDVAVRQETSFIKILEIKVVLKDVNDHQPEFKNTEVSLEFSENDSKGIRKLIPNAVDRDIGVLNSQITYQLKRNLNEPFTLSVAKSVDGTADLSITLEERLDRELQDSYRLQVIAKDGGVPQKQSVLNVHIFVVDINDNTPIFSQNIYNISANNELFGAMPVAILSATDLDAGKNGKVSYHFSSKTSRTALDHFDINSETGEIFLQKKFTSRQKMTYKLYVKATDGGSPPLSSVTMVQVNVINQQNNAPTIDVNFVSASDKNTATISEDIEVGSFIAYVKVTDVDMGQNGDVICDLHHDKFQLRSLGPKKYKVTVKNPVDRESDDHHDITINCQDRGSPPLHCESRFSIRVTDVNDAKPEFSKETFKFWTNENEKPKLPIGFINATDPDLGLGGKLTYSLLTNSKHFLPFQISDEGLISTVVSLDREFQEIYKFQVFVKDNGTPALSNTVNVIVEVKDVNDNAPYFIFPNVNPFTLDVLYYPHLTNNITVLKASDSDSRENAFLKYEITAGNDKLLFMLNHYSGFLTFTREVTPQDSGPYELEFVVRDSGTPPLSATTRLILVLTVSNKTSEMMNVVHIQTGNKIHLNLVIIVTLTAVVLSVVITASVSLCILRCNNQLNVPHRVGVNSSKKCINEQRHLMCPSYLQTSWNDVPLTITTDSDLRSSLSSKSRRGQHCGEELTEKEKCASLGVGTNLHSSSDVLHQAKVWAGFFINIFIRFFFFVCCLCFFFFFSFFVFFLITTHFVVFSFWCLFFLFLIFLLTEKNFLPYSSSSYYPTLTLFF